jgi:hypothetical protein
MGYIAFAALYTKEGYIGSIKILTGGIGVRKPIRDVSRVLQGNKKGTASLGAVPFAHFRMVQRL